MDVELDEKRSIEYNSKVFRVICSIASTLYVNMCPVSPVRDPESLCVLKHSYNGYDVSTKCHSRHCAFKHRLSKTLTPHRNVGMIQPCDQHFEVSLITIFWFAISLWRSWPRRQGESRSWLYCHVPRGESATIIYVVSPKKLDGLSGVYLGSSLYAERTEEEDIIISVI